MLEQLRKHRRIEVHTDLSNLEKVLIWFEKNHTSLVPENMVMQCKTALAEGFTNAVRHAHRDLPDSTPIEIEVILEERTLEMRIWDFGQPFDFESKLQSLLQETFEPLEKPNGRGLIFMHRLTDELSYTRTSDKRNCLSMRKKMVDD